jgi:hypothetical protein
MVTHLTPEKEKVVHSEVAVKLDEEKSERSDDSDELR